MMKTFPCLLDINNKLHVTDYSKHFIHAPHVEFQVYTDNKSLEVNLSLVEVKELHEFLGKILKENVK